jgi:hypothetical protein
VQNTRVASVRAVRRKLVKLFKEPKSRFCWYDFTVQGHRYREIHFHPLLAGSFNEPEFYAVRKGFYYITLAFLELLFRHHCRHKARQQDLSSLAE